MVCAVNRIPRARRDESDRKRAATTQIRKLYRDISTLDIAARQKITGIGPRRAEIIVPGTAVLLHVLEAFRMPALFYSAAGVRDGIIADLADARHRSRPDASFPSISAAWWRRWPSTTVWRCGTPARWRDSRTNFFSGSKTPTGSPPHYGRLLEAAAYLHDTGHYVSDTRHHKHSYYLVANSDLPGFTLNEREFIANLCRYHRKALPTPEHGNLQLLDVEGRRAVAYLIPLLRMADSLDRSHGQRIRSVECRQRDSDFLITLNVPAETDIDLEIWAAERLAEIFRQVYNKPTVCTR